MNVRHIIRVGVPALLLALLLVYLLFLRKPDKEDSGPDPLSLKKTARPEEGPDAAPPRETKPHRGPNETVITPPDSPEIKRVTDQLKTLEEKRSKYCRRLEDDDKVVIEYLVKRPSPEEEEAIKKLISQAGGNTLDSNGKPIAWKQWLAAQYLPSPDLEYTVVSLRYPKNGRKARYFVSGIPTGKLTMRGGDAPMSSDGGLHTVFPDVVIEPDDANWRYSHLPAAAP